MFHADSVRDDETVNSTTQTKLSSDAEHQGAAVYKPPVLLVGGL
jgi:hypothetical protein